MERYDGELLAGVYRHYKGHLYLVLGLAHDANTTPDFYKVGTEAVGMREVVVYVGLELQEAQHGARLAVRTVEDFFSLVHSDGSRCEGEVCIRQHDGSGSSCDMPRFTYLGATWEGQR